MYKEWKKVINFFISIYIQWTENGKNTFSYLNFPALKYISNQSFSHFHFLYSRPLLCIRRRVNWLKVIWAKAFPIFSQRRSIPVWRLKDWFGFCRSYYSLMMFVCREINSNHFFFLSFYRFTNKRFRIIYLYSIFGKRRDFMVSFINRK